MNLSNLSRCSGFFHDGDLINFKHVGNKVEIAMSSADIIPEDMIKNMPPLNENRIAGKLHLEGVKEIKINDEPFTGVLKIMYDSGGIIDFEVFKHKVILSIEWTDYPPNLDSNDNPVPKNSEESHLYPYE